MIVVRSAKKFEVNLPKLLPFNVSLKKNMWFIRTKQLAVKA